MSWTYEQANGNLRDSSGKVVGTGYSGSGAGKNNPEMQADKDVGPIPEGGYTIAQPENTIDHGPFALPLFPDLENQMYGRSGFLMHGDSIPHPGNASEGCVIQARATREEVWNSGDERLQVVRLYAADSESATDEGELDT